MPLENAAFVLFEICAGRLDEALLEPHIQQHPQAVYALNHQGQSPLTVALLENPRISSVQPLLEAWPAQKMNWAGLPLHHACTNGAAPEVMQILIDAYPQGKLQQDNQMRTPLHFYATRNFANPAQMAANAELLSDTGAAALCDRGGMYPIHYACAYGTDPAVLEVLTKVHPESLTAKENKGKC